MSSERHASRGPRAGPRRPSAGSALRWVPAFMVAWTLALLPVRGLAGPEEAELKAAFIERFTRFIEWPPGARPAPSEPFDVCVVGDSDVVAPLAALMRKGLKGHPARLRSVDAVFVEGCEVVFLADADRKAVEAVLTQTSGRPVLTIGDGGGQGRAGCLFNFYRSGSYVRFEVNREAVRRSGLHVSAKLMRLGRPVDTREGRP